jgi:hypothetical protein
MVSVSGEIVGQNDSAEAYKFLNFCQGLAKIIRHLPYKQYIDLYGSVSSTLKHISCFIGNQAKKNGKH